MLNIIYEDNPIAKILHQSRLDERKKKYGHIDSPSENIKPKLLFESFVGVAPRLFKEFFVMKPEGRKKSDDGRINGWTPKLVSMFDTNPTREEE